MIYFTMILIGLYYLHSKSIIHRDLKPENIFVDKLPSGFDILVIGDFGVSKDLEKNKTTTTNTLSGLTSPAYKAPEMIVQKKPPTPKGDLWALGVVLYQLFSGKLPFKADTPYEIEKLIMET
jgi:serine/threonine protein kinase